MNQKEVYVQTIEMASYFLSHEVMSTLIMEEMFGIPKSTLYYRLTHILPQIDPQKAELVKKKLTYNYKQCPYTAFIEKRKTLKK